MTDHFETQGVLWEAYQEINRLTAELDERTTERNLVQLANDGLVTTIQRLTAEVAEARREVTWAREVYQLACDERASFRADNARLRAALKKYVHPKWEKAIAAALHPTVPAEDHS